MKTRSLMILGMMMSMSSVGRPVQHVLTELRQERTKLRIELEKLHRGERELRLRHERIARELKALVGSIENKEVRLGSLRNELAFLLRVDRQIEGPASKERNEIEEKIRYLKKIMNGTSYALSKEGSKKEIQKQNLLELVRGIEDLRLQISSLASRGKATQLQMEHVDRRIQSH